MSHPIPAYGEARSAATDRRPPTLADRIRSALRVVRTIIGAPDYERYVQHMRERHPACDPMSRDEFMWQRLENRYSRPGSRCC